MGYPYCYCDFARICGNYRDTVNPHTGNDKYPLLRNEDLIVKLSGRNCFTIFDLKRFLLFNNQLIIKTSKTIATNKYRGFYSAYRLLFVVKFALGLFWKKFENTLKKYDFVCIFLDDVIINGVTE